MNVGHVGAPQGRFRAILLVFSHPTCRVSPLPPLQPPMPPLLVYLIVCRMYTARVDVLRRRHDAADCVQHSRRQCATLANVDVPLQRSTADWSLCSLRHHRTSTDHQLANVQIHSAPGQPLLLHCTALYQSLQLFFLFLLIFLFFLFTSFSCLNHGYYSFHFDWLRGTVVERRSLAGELSLSCARLAADG